jgi:nicotinate phosphoribosyltransferase
MRDTSGPFDLTGPIITSRLDVDFYKFTMGQVIRKKYPGVRATFTFKNRTKKVKLGRVLDLGELREHFDHARNLMFTSSHLHYLRGTNEYQERMFEEDYLQFLKNLRLPEYNLERRGDDLFLEFPGLWSENTYWETKAMAIVNGVYYRTLLRKMTRFERQAVFAEGIRRLRDKIRILRTHPRIIFSDFGTRRRFATAWQYLVDEILREELPGQFLGTSNTDSAMVNGLLPMGTSAHEMPMIIAGILDKGDADPEWLRAAQRQMLNDWWEQYGYGLSIFLPDTFGTKFFFTVVTDEELRNWKGPRHDSGELLEFGDAWIDKYVSVGVDPSSKMLVPSDGLDLPVMIAADEHFGGRIRVSDGWGTGLTNDLLDNVMIGDDWHGPMSLVVKPTWAEGRGLVKLSDNPAKATGRPEDIERYMLAAGYGAHESVECKY